MSPTVSVNPITADLAPISDDWHADIELDGLVLDAVKNRAEVSTIDISRKIIGGEIVQTMEGASTVKVTVHDPDRELLNSGLLHQSIEITVDGLRFKLASVSKSGTEIDLIFEDFSIALLRKEEDVVKFSRNLLTRAEFCVYLIRKVKANKHLLIVCPELDKKQPIKSDAKEVKKLKRSAGIANGADLHVYFADGGVRKATNSQIDEAETILDVGVKKKASDKVQASAIATVMIETGLGNPTGGDADSVGAFQQRRSQGWPATGQLETDAAAYFDVAIREENNDPSASIGEIAARTQRPLKSLEFKYAKAAKYAKAFVTAYGSANINDIAFRKRFVFSTENDTVPEDWWTAIKRLLDEVKWAGFMANGAMYIISEEDLLKSKARMIISPDTPGVNDIDFTFDIGQPVASATVTCRMGRWLAPAGSVVILKDCGPASGRWLVSTITRPLFDRNTTIELKKSDHSLKEPASDLVERTDADTIVSEHRGDVANNDHVIDNSLSLPIPTQTGSIRTGKVHILSTANRPGFPLQKPLLDFLALLAGQTSEDITINFGTNHNQYVEGTTVQSDHWLGNAADLNVDGDARVTVAVSHKGDNIAIAAMRVCGVDLSIASRHIPEWTQFNHEFTWDGHRVQIGWKTLVGGNHFNHVHIGVEP